MAICTAWLDGTDVADCLNVECDDPSVFNDAAQTASELLYQFTMQMYPGECEQTVRPCRTNCACPWQILSRGHIVWNPYWLDPYWGYGWWNCGDDACGCRPISRVVLSGFVQEVTEVLINGEVVDPDTYRVDRNRWLVRMRDPAEPDVALRWPGCQNMDLEDDQDGTWSVTYTYGREVPSAGVNAAVELAGEIWKACNGTDCKLPKGAQRLARQGVVIEKTPFASWGFESGKRGRFEKGWQTGLPQVDAFLNAYNPNGLSAPPYFWSPLASAQYAPRW